jgi:hypothetical protein
LFKGDRIGVIAGRISTEEVMGMSTHPNPTHRQTEVAE